MCDGNECRNDKDVRPEATKNDNDKNKTHMVDPITGKSVPVSEMSEHMRIQLLDPKWREQNARHQGKQVRASA